jgi:hypothetical protein
VVCQILAYRRAARWAPLDEKVDHVRGSPAGRLIAEYGDYECPYSRQAFHAIEQAGRRLGGNERFAFRHPDAVHSAGWCTVAATTRPACWRHWLLQSDQKPRRSLTMIAVIRPGVITLLMMRMLFTPLGTP